MTEHERFETNRPRLRAVAYRILGSAAEAEDAVQEAWLRLDRAGSEHIDNLDAWLTTVVGRVCLDMLRSRGSRREDVIRDDQPAAKAGPEDEALIADSVGLALLVVLETLTPAERLAFERAREQFRRDLHDGVQQTVAAARMDLDGLVDDLHGHPAGPTAAAKRAPAVTRH